jgi:8-oxo-dGTP diphosphatase
LRLVPVALAIFYQYQENNLHVWTQTRTDDGIYHGLLEFPGGGIEAGETPLRAVVREVAEEVGITIRPEHARLMGTYSNIHTNRSILLYVYLFPAYPELSHKGEWLHITSTSLSEKYQGRIPAPNHMIIDDLFRKLYDKSHEQ